MPDALGAPRVLYVDLGGIQHLPKLPANSAHPCALQAKSEPRHRYRANQLCRVVDYVLVCVPLDARQWGCDGTGCTESACVVL